MLDILSELQRQNEVELALQVNVYISGRDCFGFVGLIIFCKGIVEFDVKRIEGLKKELNFVGIIIFFSEKHSIFCDQKIKEDGKEIKKKK